MPTNKNKRRCGATNLDGARCAGWAMTQKGADPTRCNVHQPARWKHSSAHRCSAHTRAGRRCRNIAVRGRDVCCFHAGLNVPGKNARRACTATTRSDRPCRKWAVAGSQPPRCTVHGPQQVWSRPPPPARRCQARNKNGRRCRAWALAPSRVPPPQQTLCNVHAGLLRRPRSEERCTATTNSGEPCAQWAVRDSDGQYGASLCPAHLPHGDPRKVRSRLPASAERRCRAITADGERCPHWTLAGEKNGLCWMHAYPHLNPRITHGYYRTVPTYSPAVQAEIARLVAEGRPLQAAVALVRLKLRDAFVYFGGEELSHAEKDRVARLLFQGAGTVGRLLLAEKGLAGLRWGPYSAGGTGKMLASLAPDPGEPPSSTEAPRP